MPHYSLDLNQYQDNGALANFKNLLAQANTLLSNDNVTQKQIDQMLKDLTTARAALTLKETKKPTTDKNNSNNAKPKQKLPQTGDSKQTVLGLLSFSILAIGAISLKKFN